MNTPDAATLVKQLSSSGQGERLKALAEAAAWPHFEVPAGLRTALVPLLRSASAEERGAALRVVWSDEGFPDRVGILLHGSADSDVRLRRSATAWLADSEAPAAIEGLRARLTDGDEQVRFEAACGLARQGRNEGYTELAHGAADAVRRFQALGALTRLGDARARPLAEKVLGSFFATPFERTQAAGLLAKLGVESGRAALLRTLEVKRAEDRGLAMELCGELKVLAAIPALRRSLADRDDVFRGTAARSLGMLGEDPSGEGLSRIARDVKEELGVRCDAMEGLMFLGTPGARATLDALARQGQEPEVREGARDALRWLEQQGEPLKQVLP